MTEPPSWPTKDPSKFVEQVKLFEIDSGIELAPHPEDPRSMVATCRVQPHKRCVPLTLRMRAEVGQVFEVLEVAVGYNTLVSIESEREAFNHDGELPATVLQFGEDFMVRVCNRGDSPRRFVAEVWGLELVPMGTWVARIGGLVPTGRYEDGRQLLGFIECKRCGRKLPLVTGSHIPMWCGMCVEIAGYQARRHPAPQEPAPDPKPPVTDELTAAEQSLVRTLNDHADDPAVQGEVIRAVLLELAEARQAARVLAHAYDHDSRPPDWALELARKWDAYGGERGS